MPVNGDAQNSGSAPVPLIINGEDVVTTTKFDVINPVTGKVTHQSSSVSVEDANKAVEGSRAAFRQWSKLKPVARRDILLKAADIFEARKEELLGYFTEETGAVGGFTGFIFNLALQFLKDFAGRALSIEGTVPTPAEDGKSAIVVKEPNAPFILGMRAIVLPLIAGNSTVIKGSELSPKCFWALGDVFRQAGVPKGVINVIYHQPSDAREVTTALISHPSVKMVNFTGSTQVGSIIASTAGKYIKPVLLELGGKASCIVLDDADLDKAASGAVVGAFMNSGQICMSTERIVVQRRIAEKYRQRLAEKAEEMFGKQAPAPVLVTATAVDKTRKLVSDAVSKGANVLFGDIDAKEDGHASLRPTIVENVTKDMNLYATESFGPTVSLYVVDTEEEAIQLANDTDYGLTAAVFTEDLRRGLRVARQIESGAVHINDMTVHDESVLPHGGYKSSGVGRFGGFTGFDSFLQMKTITWKD